MGINGTKPILLAQAGGVGLKKKQASDDSGTGVGLKKRTDAGGVGLKKKEVTSGVGLKKAASSAQITTSAPIKFNVTDVLRNAHQFHVDKMVEKNGPDKGRPYCDPSEGGKGGFKTYSEGLGYELTQDALINDKKNFDQTLTWALNNMQRKNVTEVFDPSVNDFVTMPDAKQNNLFIWQWRPALQGSRGGAMYQPNQAKGATYWDIDPAADGDQDIAAALLWADKMWGSKGSTNYKMIALDILNDIWEWETTEINGQRYMMGGDTQIYCNDPITGEKNVTGIDISYFRIPYYMTLYAQADKVHDWKSLANPAYELIRKAQNATLHDESGSPVKGAGYLFPDWITLNSEGKIGDHGWVPADYYAGGDQFRSNAWMALQALIDPTDRDAKDYCDCAGDKMQFTECGFMKKEMNAQNKIFSGYRIDGKVQWQNETLQTMSVYMAYLKVGAYLSGDRDAAKDANILYDRIMKAYHTEGYWDNFNNQASSWTSNEHEYYGQHWAWFSIFLTENIENIKNASR
jgi:hypothetical protein